MEEYLQEFLRDRRCETRYTSFDYCYNYFYSFYKSGKLSDLSSPENIQMSCLQIGFYLGSWGMFRGGAILGQKSFKYYEPLIKWISELDINEHPNLWEIDVDSYSNDNVRERLIESFGQITHIWGNHRITMTLVTKIMLGVFGNVPAFDSNVTNFFGINNIRFNNNNKLNEAFDNFYDFYRQNRVLIDNYSNNTHTLDFSSCEQTDIHYKKAKIVDMIGFIGGQHGGRYL